MVLSCTQCVAHRAQDLFLLIGIRLWCRDKGDSIRRSLSCPALLAIELLTLTLAAVDLQGFHFERVTRDWGRTTQVFVSSQELTALLEKYVLLSMDENQENRAMCLSTYRQVQHMDKIVDVTFV